MGRGSETGRHQRLALRPAPLGGQSAIEDGWRLALQQVGAEPDAGALPARFALVTSDGRGDRAAFFHSVREALDDISLCLFYERGFVALWDLGAVIGAEPARVLVNIEHSVETGCEPEQRPAPAELRWRAHQALRPGIDIINPEIIDSGEARFLALLRTTGSKDHAVAASQDDVRLLLDQVLHQPLQELELIHDIGCPDRRHSLASVAQRVVAVVDGVTHVVTPP